MKKIIASALLVASAATASAQVQTIDFKAAVSSDFGLGAGVTADLTEYIEFAPSATFYFNNKTHVQGEADFHYKFDLGDEFTFYPLIGGGFDFNNNDHSHSSDINLVVNAGAGLKKSFAPNLAGFVECKYQWVGGDGAANIAVGIKLAL